MGLFDSFIAAAAPAVGAYFGGPAGAAAGAAVSGYLGGESTNQSNRSIAESNNAWSAQQYATRYQTMVKDMEAAGLNPMLAYSQSPGQAPTAQAVSMQNPVSSAMDAYRSVRSSESGAARDYAGAQHSISSAGAADQSVKESEARIKQIDANVTKIVQETQNIPTEGQRLAKIVEQLGHQTNLTIAQEFLTNAQRNQVIATIAKIRKETSLLDFDVSAALNSQNWGREFKEFGPALQMIIDILKPRRFP